MTNRRNPSWRETATDCDLFEHVQRTIERLRDHAKFAQDVVSGEMSPVHVLILTDSLTKTVDELALRADDREQMDATRPEKPEPPVRDCLTDLFERAAADVADDSPSIILSVN